MQQIAAKTGGIFYKAPDSTALQAAFIAIAQTTNIRIKR
jgi:hypothetical protein